MPQFNSMFKGLGKLPTGLERNVNSLDDTNQNMMGSAMRQADEGLIGNNGELANRTKNAPNVPDLLDASFRNIPKPQDQEVIDPKHAMSVWEEHNYPTVPLFNRKENFQKMDLDTLFFAFYYQQGTY